MNLSEIGKTIAKFAPLLGGVIAGPAGAAIGNIVAAEFGGDINQPQELIQKIQADPNAQIKLVEIQSNCRIELQRIAAKMAEDELKDKQHQREIEAQDRDSARRRQEIIKDRTPAYLAYILTFEVGGALAFLFRYEVPNDNKELIVAVLSTLLTLMVAAYAFYHGSSAGSRLKDTLASNPTLPLPAASMKALPYD